MDRSTKGPRPPSYEQLNADLGRYREELHLTQVERDELRAENERLRENLVKAEAEVEETCAENERWKAGYEEYKALYDRTGQENEQLRAWREQLRADLAAHHALGYEREMLPGTVMCEVCKQVRLEQSR